MKQPINFFILKLTANNKTRPCLV